MAQETGPKPALPVEKMLSKKVCPIPSSLPSESYVACVRHFSVRLCFVEYQSIQDHHHTFWLCFINIDSNMGL